MTAVALTQAVPGLGPAVLGHLGEQVASAERLLEAILRQAVSIRERDVEGVLAAITEMQTEMERRAALERVRADLLLRAAGALGGVPAHAVTLDALCSLLNPQEAAAARERSAQLRGLLSELGRRHQLNRALMRQELAFLEHLTRLLGAEEDTGYTRGVHDELAPSRTAAAHRVLDLQA